MRVLAVHPSCLMYSKIFLRLEPLGLECVAEALRRAGHTVYLLDLQVEQRRDYLRALERFRPHAVAFSLNYLANVPEVIDLAKETKERLPEIFIFVGGHSASFIPGDILSHAEGAVDCVLRGEGERNAVALLEALEQDPKSISSVPGAYTREGPGPRPQLLPDLDEVRPARDLLRHRRSYFIGELDPCASIEFSRGCPWDCSFCSGWTFYSRSYRKVSPERAVEDLERIQEPNVFIVDDVAFVDAKHGTAIGELIAKKNIKKRYYLETRCDVLLRNKDVFRLWRRLGLEYMFIGIEALDEEGLKRFRKRVTVEKNNEALEFARSLGITVAINIIADPQWDRERFESVRRWCLQVPEIVNISVNTPYPGTESWVSDHLQLTTRDYRLFDIQHAVLPTRLPLRDFYEELVKTQQVLNRKHLGWAGLKAALGIAAGNLLRGQTNFVRMLWKFNSVYNPKLQLGDHWEPVRYRMSPPPSRAQLKDKTALYIHEAQHNVPRALDAETEKFVRETRHHEDQS